MKKRKFEVLSVELSPGGAGPEYAYRCKCRMIENKKWIEKEFWSLARNKDEAKTKLEERYSGKN